MKLCLDGMSLCFYCFCVFDSVCRVKKNKDAIRSVLACVNFRQNKEKTTPYWIGCVYFRQNKEKTIPYWFGCVYFWQNNTTLGLVVFTCGRIRTNKKGRIIPAWLVVVEVVLCYPVFVIM